MDNYKYKEGDLVVIKTHLPFSAPGKEALIDQVAQIQKVNKRRKSNGYCYTLQFIDDTMQKLNNFFWAEIELKPANNRALCKMNILKTIL